MSEKSAADLPAMTDLLQLMVRLRDPVAGCPWDRAQTFASLAPYTLEEAYEVVDAIQAGETPAKLRDELGDLLFQVVFYAQLAQERGWFDSMTLRAASTRSWFAGIRMFLGRRRPVRQARF
ncbi:MAG: MazG nucleotide pyrophosphohydrolase domain-containing protein [Steroidobacteraceae bacterium]